MSFGDDRLIATGAADDRARAIADLTARFGELDLTAVIPLLIDYTPASALPHLVEQFDMGDFVRPTMSDQTIRNLLKGAVALKSRLGTRWAVEFACQAAGVVARITEWWQTDPAGTPNTFTVELSINANLTGDGRSILDEARIADLAASIDAAKRTSQHYTTSVTGRMTAPVHAAAVMQCGDVITIEPYQLEELAGSGRLYMAAAELCEDIITIEPPYLAARAQSGRAALAAASIGFDEVTVLPKGGA